MVFEKCPVCITEMRCLVIDDLVRCACTSSPSVKACLRGVARKKVFPAPSEDLRISLQIEPYKNPLIEVLGPRLEVQPCVCAVSTDSVPYTSLTGNMCSICTCQNAGQRLSEV